MQFMNLKIHLAQISQTKISIWIIFNLSESVILNTPVIPMAIAGVEYFKAISDDSSKQVLDNMEDAIAVATTDLGLLPGVAFQARVTQLSQLCMAHKSVSHNPNV